VSRSLKKLVEELGAAQESLTHRVAAAEWDLALKYARDAARASGQVLQRLAVMVEIANDSDDD
jgi:hypothetical protein